jgi:hypothetical protein
MMAGLSLAKMSCINGVTQGVAVSLTDIGIEYILERIQTEVTELESPHAICTIHSR